MAGAPPGATQELNASQLAFDATVAKLTGLNQYVVQAWSLAEEPASRSPQAQGYNWLNIGPGRAYSSDLAAARATAALINSSGYYSGIRSAAKSGNPSRELAAIAASPWDVGHYGSSASNPLGNLAGTYQIVSSKKVSADPITSGINTVVSAPGKAAGAVGSAASSVGSALGKLTDPGTWISFGFVVLGLALIGIGLTRGLAGKGRDPMAFALARRLPAAAVAA